jgi:MFS family permease
MMPIVMFGIGAMMFPLYSLVVSYTLDWTDNDKTVGAAGTLVRINGTGALLGPLIAATLMSRFGSAWFFWSMAGFFGVVVVYLTYRIAFKEAMPQERQRAFVPFPARATMLAFQLIAQPVKTTKRVGRVVVARRPGAPQRAIRSDEPVVSEIAESYDAPPHGTSSTDW